MNSFWEQVNAISAYLVVAAAYGLCVGVALGKPAGILAALFVLALVLLCKGMQHETLDLDWRRG